MSYPARQSRSCKTIEREAHRVRRVLGFSSDDELPGCELFGSLNKYKIVSGGLILPLTYEVRELEPGVEAEARFDLEKSEIVVCLSATTYENLEQEQPRARFTLFHEIGHAVMHHAELRSLARIDRQKEALMRGQRPDIPPYKDTEWQAHNFAAALAVPVLGLERLRLQGRLDEASVKSAFRVSGICARKRIQRFEERRVELLRAVANP